MISLNMRKSLKSRESSSRTKDSISTPPLTPSRRSPQPAQQPAPRPAQRDDIQSQVDSIILYFQSFSVNLPYQLSDFFASVSLSKPVVPSAPARA